MMINHNSPIIGVVIPLYKHSILVGEAITSVIEQSVDFHTVTLIINDGCPSLETDMCAKSFAQAFPEKVHYVHTRNGGLSAARNRGIRLLLEQYPSIQGILLLDADNRLERNSFRLLGNLLDRHPNSDWFYPQFDMFGLVTSASHGGQWSLLMHSANNLSEAGSLVRRRVFENGVWYDESMRLGYEDWDFWLSAAKQGFRGHAVKEPFLQYRKRPESMLSGSHQVDVELRSFMRRKHKWLFNPKTALRLEHAEAPRCRVFFKDDSSILALCDPHTVSGHLTRDCIEKETWSTIAAPSDHDMGLYWIITDLETWEYLKERGLARFVLWDLERRMAHGNPVAVCSLESSDTYQYEIAAAELGKGAILAINKSVIKDAILDDSHAWLEKLITKTAPNSEGNLSLKIKDFPNFIQNNLSEFSKYFNNIILHLRNSRYRANRSMSLSWRKFDYPAKENIHYIARKCADSGILYPLIQWEKTTPSVCFLLPIAEFGGVETVALGIAKAMRQNNWHTALCMVGTNPVKLADHAASAFNEIMWFPDSSLLDWGGPIYRGTHLARGPEGETARDLFGLLSSFDCVLGSHAAGAVSMFGELKKNGVVTVLHEHVMETSPWGRDYGPPMIALSCEAAIDIMATCSEQLANWFHAQGVPQQKLIPVINTAGYDLEEDARQSFLEARRQSWKEPRPLRVLYLGRLDWQKGLDRIAQVMESLQMETSDIHWRIVGKAVIEGGDADIVRLKKLVNIEPPVYTPIERTALYSWADVVLLPSRYEGLPLTVFEAQQLGAIPIMTKVGAYNEAVDHGVNGILVSKENCVKEISEALMHLLADREELHRMSDAAAAGKRTWEMAAAPLIERIETEVARSSEGFTSKHMQTIEMLLTPSHQPK